MPDLTPESPVSEPAQTTALQGSGDPSDARREPAPRWGRALGWGIFAFLMIVFAANLHWVVKNVRSLRALGPGERAPDFELATLEGDRVRLADLRGRVLLIEFWSVTCPPCLEALPKLNQIVKRFTGEPVTVLGIHIQGGPRWESAVAAEAASLGLRFPILLDPGSLVSDAFRVRMLPTLVLVDRQGRIRKVWRGSGDISSYEAEIRRALRE